MALYITMSKREYTIADFAERMEYHKERLKNQDPSSQKVVFRQNYPEEDPKQKAYYRSGALTKKQMREKVLNHKLKRWF